MSVPIKEARDQNDKDDKVANTAPERKLAGKFSDHPIVALRQEVDQLFEELWSRSSVPSFRNIDFDWPKMPPLSRGMGVFSSAPKSDVSETDKDYVIRTELPGMSEKEVEVSVVGHVITIKGEKRSERNEDKADYHLSECSYGSFQRTFKVPEGVDAEKIKAEFDSGVLTLTLAKDQKTVPKKITVKAKEK